MSSVTIAAVQAAYVLMDQEATLTKAVERLAKAAAGGSRIVVFPEVFIPGNPIWIDAQPIWDGDGDWYAMLVDQAVTIVGREQADASWGPVCQADGLSRRRRWRQG